jgi:hypothetical protein
VTEPDAGSDAHVKELLGRALTGEPPLALDRDEVFREGRRRVRRRRVFSTGGAIAGVVAAAVGAVMLTGLLADEAADEQVPPGASRPAQPPVTTTPPTTTVTTTPLPPTSGAPSQVHANALSRDFLQHNDVLPKTAQLSRADGETPRFTVTADAYELKLDVRLPAAEGSLAVSVGAADPAGVARCSDVSKNGCVVRAARGIRVVIGTWKDYGTGEKRYIAFAVRPDGTSVRAIATNLSDRQRNKGALPADRTPVLDQDTLARLVTMPALRYAG